MFAPCTDGGGRGVLEDRVLSVGANSSPGVDQRGKSWGIGIVNASLCNPGKSGFAAPSTAGPVAGVAEPSALSHRARLEDRADSAEAHPFIRAVSWHQGKAGNRINPRAAGEFNLQFLI